MRIFVLCMVFVLQMYAVVMNLDFSFRKQMLAWRQSAGRSVAITISKFIWCVADGSHIVAYIMLNEFKHSSLIFWLPTMVWSYFDQSHLVRIFLSFFLPAGNVQLSQSSLGRQESFIPWLRSEVKLRNSDRRRLCNGVHSILDGFWT